MQAGVCLAAEASNPVELTKHPAIETSGVSQGLW